jgi:GNAT superfamily N-acetyltransferase
MKENTRGIPVYPSPTGRKSFGRLVKSGFKILGRYFYRSFPVVLMEKRLCEESSLPTILSWREAGPDDLALLSEFLPTGKIRLFRKRLQNRECCLVGLEAGEIVHYFWLTVGKSYLDRELDFRIDLRPDKGYLYDAYTRPGFRGRGCYQEALREAGRVLGNRGQKILLVIISGGNEPARVAALRAGFRPVAVILHRRILAWKWNLIRRTSDGEQLADS